MRPDTLVASIVGVALILLGLSLFSFGGMMYGWRGSMMGGYYGSWFGMAFVGTLIMVLILVALVLFIPWLIKQLGSKEQRRRAR